MAGALVNLVMTKLVGSTGFSGTDRLLGMIFGVLRGLVVVSVVVLIMGLTPMPEEPFWQESTMIGGLEPWVCRVGADEWMQRLFEYGEAAEGLMPEQTYWQSYCAGGASGTSAPETPVVPDEL